MGALTEVHRGGCVCVIGDTMKQWPVAAERRARTLIQMQIRCGGRKLPLQSELTLANPPSSTGVMSSVVHKISLAIPPPEVV